MNQYTTTYPDIAIEVIEFLRMEVEPKVNEAVWWYAIDNGCDTFVVGHVVTNEKDFFCCAERSPIEDAEDDERIMPGINATKSKAWYGACKAQHPEHIAT